MDGLAKCVFSGDFAFCWNPRHRRDCSAIASIIAKQQMYRNVWLAESSRAAALWRHDQDISHQNMVPLSIFQARLAYLQKKIRHHHAM